MKFCQPHWNALRDAIKAQGLEGFVAKDGADCVRREMENLKGTSDPHAPHDPLMACHWAIVNRLADMANPGSKFGFWLVITAHSARSRSRRRTANAELLRTRSSGSTASPTGRDQSLRSMAG